MNESLLSLLSKVTLFDLLLAIMLILVLVSILITQKKKISTFLDRWRVEKNEDDDFKKLVYDLKESMQRINSIVDKQSNDIRSLTDIVVNMQAKNSKTKRAEIKRSIERIYSECHPAMICTDMQFEALRDLIEEYEEHGGVNSFVHNVVQPEMHVWNKISRISNIKEEQ